MGWHEFNALHRGLHGHRSSKHPNPDHSGVGWDASRNPRTARRSGCTPAEPYPPCRTRIMKTKSSTFKGLPVDNPHTRSLVALWDSTVNSETSIYTGFHYLCIGYFLENSCFMGAFIYKYFNVEKEKKDIEFQHKLQLFTSKIEMQQQTMQDIGREIHDNIGQKLTLASLHIQQLTYENKVPQINTNMESISTTINKSLAELRELSKSLTNDMIDINSISKLLEEECIKINNLKICAAHFKFETDKRMLSYQVKSVLLRISQEFIQNSIKHSDCKNISISLLINNNLIVLNLEDDGKGFDIHKNLGTGIGLNNMKKRTEIIGGNYDLQSNLNGTKLVVEIPSK